MATCYIGCCDDPVYMPRCGECECCELWCEYEIEIKDKYRGWKIKDLMGLYRQERENYEQEETFYKVFITVFHSRDFR